VLIWDFTQHRMVACYRGSLRTSFRPHHSLSKLRTQVFLAFFLDYFILVGGTKRLPCNVGKKLPIYTAYNPKRAQNPFTPRGSLKWRNCWRPVSSGRTLPHVVTRVLISP